jgi:hypothetical protein
MKIEIKSVVASIADFLFLPVHIEYRDYFTKPLRAVVLLFFIYFLIIAMPPVIEFVKEGSFFLPFM